MHWECESFLSRVKRAMPSFFSGGRIVEAGAYNVNGTARSWFDNPSEYIGVDWRAGPCVDRVGVFHELDLGDGFDVGVSTETLEHDRFWRDTIAKFKEIVRPGGLIVITAAAFARPVHGVEFGNDGYYANIQPAMIRPLLENTVFYEEDRIANDIRCAWING